MKLLKLHIYGFGKHENIEIDLNNGINVFFGENEAGKTTIQQFILHILFDFHKGTHSYFAMSQKAARPMEVKFK